MKKIIIVNLSLFIFSMCFCMVCESDPSPVTPNSVTGRVLPLPLEQSSRRIKIGWEVSSSGSVTHYCVYKRKTTSPPTGASLNNQPCYDLSDSAVSVSDTDSMSVDVTSGAGPNGRDMWSVTASGLDYEYWYVFQITANQNSASCSACVHGSIDNDNFSFPSPYESYGVYIPKSSLKWQEYTD